MSLRVLVVDDEPDTLFLLKTILEISGFVPITTLNSVEAVALAEVEHPDVVLLDIMMPKPNGFELCKIMRGTPSTAKLPIIFVTAYSALDLYDRSKEAGGDYIVHKPINFDFLQEAIPLVIKMRQKDQSPLQSSARLSDLSISADDTKKSN